MTRHLAGGLMKKEASQARGHLFENITSVSGLALVMDVR